MAPTIPQEQGRQSEDVGRPRPVPRPSYPKPLLRLICTDLREPQTQRLLRLFDVHEVLDSAVTTVLSLLYPGQITSDQDTSNCDPPWPTTRSITLFFDTNYGGVAATGGLDIDNDHKEMKLATSWAQEKPEDAFKREITGVIVHEMVHCWQWDGMWSQDCGAPGGLVEGIADWVRLKAGLAPEHWRREAKREGGPWQGYQLTAYFLDWLEEGLAGKDVGGEGTVMKVNAHLKRRKYHEERFWLEVVGRDVSELWREYCDWLETDLERERQAQDGEQTVLDSSNSPSS